MSHCSVFSTAGYSLPYALTVCFGSMLAVWAILPRLWQYLPTDQGRENAVNASKSVGKPVGAGLIFIGALLIISGLLMPKIFAGTASWLYPCIFIAMLTGYVDDKTGGLSPYVLAAVDFVLAAIGSMMIFGFEPVLIWLPFTVSSFAVPAFIYLPFSVGVIWFAINATNCSDGVDGLAGHLTIVSLILLSILLFLMGNEHYAEHMHMPNIVDGQYWALFGFLLSSILVSYLWYNIRPSQVMMGDAGSRPIGYIIGLMCVVTHNPLMIFIVASIILLNGAVGIFKLVLLRFLKISIFSKTRFPFHDHCRSVWGWSDQQTVSRLWLLHLLISVLLIVLMLGYR